MSLQKITLCISPSFIHTYIIFEFRIKVKNYFWLTIIFVLTFGGKLVIILSMNENDISYLIFLFFSVTGAYYFGKQTGIRGTIDYLEEKGILNFDDSEK